MSAPTTSAARLYGEGIRAASYGQPHHIVVRDESGYASPFTVDAWTSEHRPGDERFLRRCTGPTLDVGCGPGRVAAALGRRGVPVLGVDIVPAAVRAARDRGVLALRRSVFDPLPGEGRWSTVALADGNLGIGGDPLALLHRCRELLAPDGRIVVELDAVQGLRRVRVRLERGSRHSEWLDWAVIGADAVPSLAHDAGLEVLETWTESGRWFAVLSSTA